MKDEEEKKMLSIVKICFLLFVWSQVSFKKNYEGENIFSFFFFCYRRRELKVKWKLNRVICADEPIPMVDEIA